MKHFTIYEFMDIIEEADIIYGYVQANASVRLRARVRKKAVLQQLSDMIESPQFDDKLRFFANVETDRKGRKIVQLVWYAILALYIHLNLLYI